MAIPTSFPAFRIHNDAAGYRAGIESISLDDLNPGEVVIKTVYGATLSGRTLAMLALSSAIYMACIATAR